MPQLEIDGYETLDLIGEGACGSVYMARKDEDDELVAIRVFNALAINRSLIENTSGRILKGSYPEGVIPITWAKPRPGSQYMVMPMLAELDEGDKTITPNNLQEQISDYPKETAWETIEKIAHALGSMHRRHIPHGNLKPSNIFFQKDDSILLTDFAMGHMPGVGILPFTDSLLHAPPEQLQNPEDYHSGSGYGWDIYAFAVIAFRLLTGKFPRCDKHFHDLTSDQNSELNLQNSPTKIAESLEQDKIADWPKPAKNEHERKRRDIILRCLSLNPEDRYNNINEVIQAWESIDRDVLIVKEKALQKKKVFFSKCSVVMALMLAAAGAIGCLVLKGQLENEKKSRAEDSVSRVNDIDALNQKIQDLNTQQAVTAKSASYALLQRNQATEREEKSRAQLIALGMTNDRLLTWMLRDRNTDLPELQKTGPDKTAADAIERELKNFLELTEGEAQYQPIRSRISLQLAELKIHHKQPKAASEMLDSVLPELAKLNINDFGQDYRIARARLICLMQAQDQEDAELVTELLPKARQAIAELKTADPTETQRIKATMEIIDGRLIQKEKPAEALAHFQSAIKNLKGIQKSLPENVGIRTDIAKHILHSSELAKSLDRVDDATKLKGEAAEHLKWLLEKNPNIVFAKIKLAEIEIMAAESHLISGYGGSAEKKLIKAEKLLEGTDTKGTSVNGAGMQLAVAKGLRAVVLRDRRQTSSAIKHLDYAIYSIDRISKANPTASGPLYRLAEFKWQRASLAGAAGDRTKELKLGGEAATLMQKLLKEHSGKRDDETLRALAYLYGSLGHTATSKGDKGAARSYYKKAATSWQKLIDKNGKKNEYTEGLRWSNKRVSQVSE